MVTFFRLMNKQTLPFKSRHRKGFRYYRYIDKKWIDIYLYKHDLAHTKNQIDNRQIFTNINNQMLVISKQDCSHIIDRQIVNRQKMDRQIDSKEIDNGQIITNINQLRVGDLPTGYIDRQ